MVRGRIKDVQTCSRLVSSIAEFQAFEDEYDDIKYESKIPGRKSSFGVFVSDEESNHGMIYFEKAFDLTEHSPRNTY